MSTVQNFEDLEIWQLAREQCKEFFHLVKTTELKTDFKLRDQMNDSSGSVMDNIAEGFGRGGNAELKHFLVISKGSNSEYRSQLYRCIDRGYLQKDKETVSLKRNELISKKQMSFISFLQGSELKGVTRAK